MWIFTKLGFYSVVLAKQGDGGYYQPIDPDRVMIRARRRQHLLNLKEEFDLLASSQIIENESTDYRYRLICSKKTWADIMKVFVIGIEYANFKNECSKGELTDHQYSYALHDVWEVMYKTQS